MSVTSFVGQEFSQGENIQLVSALIFSVLIGSSLLFRYNGRFGTFFKDALTWIAIVILLVGLYSYRYEFSEVTNRILGELRPSHVISVSGKTVRVKRSSNGHFYINAHVNGHMLRFLVDTGATDTVISMDHAKKIGINIYGLNFNKSYATANGVVKGAPIIIRKIQVGDLILANVKASVNEADLRYPLLGLSFLNRLKSYKVEGASLTLTFR